MVFHSTFRSWKWHRRGYHPAGYKEVIIYKIRICLALEEVMSTSSTVYSDKADSRKERVQLFQLYIAATIFCWCSLGYSFTACVLQMSLALA